MDFNTKGHEAKEGGVSAFLSPGIHTAKITGVAFYESNGGTPGFKISFEGKPIMALENKGQTADTTYLVSTKAWPFTKDRLCIMADKVGVREKLDAIEASGAEDYAKAINNIFTGITARFKFSGQEIVGKPADDGTMKKNWFKAELSAFGFVEPLTVPADKSELKFDETDKYDMKRLAPMDVVADDPLANDGEDSGNSDWD